MYGEIVAAVNSVKALGELLKSAKSLANYNELVAAVSEVNGKLMAATAVALEAQGKQSELAAKIIDLEKRLAEVEDWNRKIGRYQLHEFPTGVLAFALKKEMADGEPMHYLCTNCVDRRHISRLQPTGGRYYLKCHPCNLAILIEPLPPPSKQPPPNPDGWMTGRW